MIEEPLHPNRRVALASALAAACASDARAGRATPARRGPERDWAPMAGEWQVRHRQLKGRLVGATEWIAFGGTTRFELTMGGLGNMDDNVIDKPDGTYRAMTVRAWDPGLTQWSIWWVDGRNPQGLDPPMQGTFRDGVGTFLGDSVLNDRPIKVRFLWTGIGAGRPRWEQAFSADGGATWEVNWIMEFTRA